MKYASVVLLALVVAAFGAVVGTNYSPTDTISPNPSKDTWVWTGYGPYGTSTELRINNDRIDQRPVLAWDLSSIEGYIINSATFYVYHYQGNGGTLSANIYRVTEDWNEYTLVAPLDHDGDTVWASGDAGDPNGWKSFDLTDLVQAWVDGDYPNYGIICKGIVGTGYQSWYSRESGTPPYLEIDYEEPPNVSRTTWGAIKAEY